MSDEELLRWGNAARSLCCDKSPGQVFVIQLQEARIERIRQNPKA
jgi:hypothetical protein